MADRSRESRTTAPREYQSYLLRMWRANLGESAIWRASLEDTRTGQWHSFADLEATFRFLDAIASQSGAGKEGAQPYSSVTERHDH
jgi:hypothetical protein